MNAAGTAVLLGWTLLAPPAAARAEEKPGYQRTEANYTAPDVTLINQRGERVRLRELIRTDRPLLLDFVFTSCTTICPILSANFVNLQKRLGPESANFRFVSISIDPENDTPDVTAEYLARYRAAPGWDFLTGRREDVEQVMRAFNAYVANKMTHLPLMFLRSPKSGRWVRISGLLGTGDLLAECRKLDQ